MKILLALLVSCGSLGASEFPLATANRIADAIWIAEGGTKARWPYGVLRVSDPVKARRICLQIIQSEWEIYERLVEAGGARHSYIEFLALRYCPPAAHPLNERWPFNVTFHFRKLKP